MKWIWYDLFRIPETHPRSFNIMLVIAFGLACYGLMSR